MTKTNMLRIELKNWKLNDQAIADFVAWLPSELEKLQRQQTIQHKAGIRFLADKVDLSENEISDEGIRCLLKAFQELQIAAGILMLYKNKLGLESAALIADWIRWAALPPYELHLSHNFIPEEGAVKILEAVAAQARYPSERPAMGKHLCPVWLRLEGNVISDPAGLQARIDGLMRAVRPRGAPPGPMVCWVSARSDQTGCRSSWCKRAVGHEVAVVHLTYFDKQRQNFAGTSCVPEASNQAAVPNLAEDDSDVEEVDAAEIELHS